MPLFKIFFWLFRFSFRPLIRLVHASGKAAISFLKLVLSERARRRRPCPFKVPDLRD